MKSLIITLTGNYNYGNRLQNYALQEVLKRKELEVETYNNIYMNPKTQEIKIKNAKMDLKRIIRGIKSRILKKDKYKVQDKKRSVKIKDFNDKYIIMSDKKKEELNGAYDYFILGSDQVWNPNFVNDLDINLASCLNGNIISYAASFGVDKIYNNVYDLYKTSLMKMDYISVREKNGKILAEQLSNKNVKIVLDPTMLLTVQEWENLEEKPEIYDEKKYLLIYCVSKEHNKLRKYVNKIAKEKHLNIIDLSDKDSKEYISGVEEFLFYIHHAEMIFTDSFHACVFSILFKKDFWIIERSKQIGMNDRIDTLLSTFNLKNRKLTYNKLNNLQECNYNDLDKILEREKKISMEFLEEALKIKEK